MPGPGHPIGGPTKESLQAEADYYRKQAQERAANKVIELKFVSPHMQEDTMAYLSCKVCRNKTFTLIMDHPVGEFPLMRCACCGNHAGRMGWSHDDDPANLKSSS